GRQLFRSLIVRAKWGAKRYGAFTSRGLSRFAFAKIQSSLNLATRTFPQISSATNVGANPLLPLWLESANVPDLLLIDRSGTPRKSKAFLSAKRNRSIVVNNPRSKFGDAPGMFADVGSMRN